MSRRRPAARCGAAAVPCDPRRREALGLDDEIGDFQPGKAADFVYLRPPPDSVFAAVLERADSPEQALAALFTLAGADCVREVRVAGDVVFRKDQDSSTGRRSTSGTRQGAPATLAELNTCYDRRFVETLGWIFEGSPWIAERAWTHRPFGQIAELHAAMMREVVAATRQEQLALLRAHPDLGTRASMSALRPSASRPVPDSIV